MITQVNSQNNYINANSQHDAQSKKVAAMEEAAAQKFIVPGDSQALKVDKTQEIQDQHHLRTEKEPFTDYSKIGKHAKPIEVPKQDDSVASMIADKVRAQRIAMKIARGEVVTMVDKSFIQINEPGLVLEAERAVQNSKKIELEMQSKPTIEAKKQFLQQAKNNAIGFNGASAELLIGAIDKLTVND